MGKTPSTESELKPALEAFEVALDTPVVSGELADWLESVGQAWANLSAQLSTHFSTAHTQQLQEIGEQDLELLPRVEQLEAEDAAILEEGEALAQTVARTTTHAPKLEPDEEKAQAHIKMLIDDGLAFVARVRRQEVAIQTWFIEAFNRDRGPVD
jgi:hypothetical protein